MAKYYYKRYAAKPQYSKSGQSSSYYSRYDYLPEGDVYRVRITNPALESLMIAESLWININTGYYADGTLLSGSNYLDNSNLYLLICSATEAWSIVGNGYSISTAHGRSNGVRLYSKYTITPTYIAGEFVDELIAEDGTYPDDGYNESDGYYYVKDRMAIQFFVRMNGAWTETQPHVRANGAWREAEIHPRIDGAWLG